MASGQLVPDGCGLANPEENQGLANPEKSQSALAALGERLSARLAAASAAANVFISNLLRKRPEMARPNAAASPETNNVPARAGQGSQPPVRRRRGIGNPSVSSGAGCRTVQQPACCGGCYKRQSIM